MKYPYSTQKSFGASFQNIIYEYILFFFVKKQFFVQKTKIKFPASHILIFQLQPPQT